MTIPGRRRGPLGAGRGRWLAGAALLLLVAGCASAPSGRRGYSQRGLASWYGPGFHGKRTANGEVYDMHALTAAHKKLPFDTVVEVRNRDNGRRVRVRINDRGPFVRGRIIDLSLAAAQRIDLLGPGVARVEIEVVKGKGRPETVVAGGSWLVQAGAFRTPGRADEAATAVRAIADAPVRVIPERDLYKVVVGPLPTRKRARQLARRLRAKGQEAFVRPQR